MRRSLLALAVLLFSFAVSMPAHAEKWKEVSAKDLKAMMDAGGVTVVNPLSRIEFNDLAIKGSINIPIDELKGKLPKDTGAKIVFYCLGPK